MASSYFDDIDRYSSKEDTPTLRDFPSAWTKEEKSAFEKLPNRSESGPGSRSSWYDYTKQNLFNKAEEKKKEQPQFGQSTGGSAGQVFEGFGAVFPQTHAPVYMPGVEGRGVLSTIAGIAAPIVGAMGGPTAPFISAGLGGLSSTGW